MMSRRPLAVLVATAFLLLLDGCKTPDPALDASLSRLVVMKYAHLANVTEMDAPGPSGVTRIAPTDGTGFWAVFDICSLDVQGSALTGFDYEAANFFVDGGTISYGAMNPGTVNTGFGGPRSAFDPQVRAIVHDALHLSPTTQHFPKQFYPGLRFRIAIFVNGRPPGYLGDALTLKYTGQPVATVIESVSPANPVPMAFFSYLASPGIVGTCP